MGRFIYGGRVCFYMPCSSDDSQPRSADRHWPLLSTDLPDEQLLLRRIRALEEGLHVRPQPPPPNAAAWKYFKIICRCFMAALSISLMVGIFVARHFNLDPYLQDPYKMIVLLIFALGPVGFGFMMTQGDIETQGTLHGQEEPHL
uniref:Uncharacterized protein n=1 Tax=Avena sativa TaxID=4498 RepID=A0ACD5WCI5_AVESA